MCGKIHDRDKKCRKYERKTDEQRLRSTWAWTQKSLEVRKKAFGLCEVCRDQGDYTYKNISVHHIIKLKENPDVLLDNDLLIALCERHHEDADAGRLSTDYLKALASIRENEPPRGYG